MKAVGQPIRKKDAMALVTGKPVFMDDLAPKDCLIVKVLRSPHANAIVKSVKTDVECRGSKISTRGKMCRMKDSPQRDRHIPNSVRMTV